MTIKEYVVIDTDAGHDDVLAMMLIWFSPSTLVEAITTVAGNSTIEKVTRNARAALDLIHCPLPVHSGSRKPLARELVRAVVHGDSGLDGLDVTRYSDELTDDAVETIISAIEARPGQITILTIGPLTNIAQVLMKRPDLVGSIKQVVMMGGAIKVPGNKNRVAEFNFFVDPEAADIVFKSDVKKILIPLDPCNSVRLYMSDFAKLKHLYFYKELHEMMIHFISGIQKFEAVDAALVYDALAAYYLVAPEAYELQEMDIVIETKGEHTFGMTVADRRIYSQKRNNVYVATKIDEMRFRQDFTEIISNAS